MKQTEPAEAFLKGAVEGDANSLHIVGSQPIHYNTPIAGRHDDKIILSYIEMTDFQQDLDEDDC